MTEAELFAAIRSMLPNAVNVICFHALFDTEGFNPTPIHRIEYECHIAAAGYALAFQVHQLAEQLRAEGIEP